jgi:regulator of sirC expression with transglutaminase-like and TPR domain
MNQSEIETQIADRMSLDEFLRIQERLVFLRGEEEMKLKALAELQQVYVSASTDQQRDLVKEAVAQIREISRKTREEIRALNSVIYERMPLEEAKQLYEKYLQARHNPK